MRDSQIDPGELNVRLAWARHAVNPNGKGGSTKGPTAEYLMVPAGSFWAKVETLRGAERYAAAQLRATVDTKITMRDVGDVRPLDTLTTEGAHPTTYVVETPTRPGERPGWIVLTATASVAP